MMGNAWQLLSGVAIFLIGTRLMEEALKQMAGRKFKLLLKKYTANSWKAVGGGALVTALLQSSSVVNLLMLSLVGSGVIRMRQALAVMLGSNVGTTFTGWMIVMLGFKLNLEGYALPVLGVSGMLFFYTRNESKGHRWAQFFLGFSLLFLGLDWMRISVETLVSRVDLSQLAAYPLIIFFVAGVVMTALVQASSVILALCLSALYSNAITLEMAAALILGAEIGTTIKLALASWKGVAAKKRVALGNIMFNILTSLILFLFLRPALYLVTEGLSISNSLLALTSFQTLINLVGIVLFFPLLKPFGRFLDNRFQEESMHDYLKKIKPSETDLVLEAMNREVLLFIRHYAQLVSTVFDLPFSFEGKNKNHLSNHSFAEAYNAHKKKYGDLHAFSASWLLNGANGQEAERMAQLINSLRNTMYAAKSIKDARDDIEQLRNSSNDEKYGFYLHLKENVQKFLLDVEHLCSKKTIGAEEVVDVYQRLLESYQEDLKRLYDEVLSHKVDGIEIATMLNVHREIVSSFKSAVFAMKDYFLTSKEGLAFDLQPGFIR